MPYCPAIQVAVPKGKSVNAKFHKTNVLQKLKKHFKAGGNWFGQCQTAKNASSQKESIVQDFLKQEKVVVLPHPPYLALCDFLFVHKAQKIPFWAQLFKTNDVVS